MGFAAAVGAHVAPRASLSLFDANALRRVTRTGVESGADRHPDRRADHDRREVQPDLKPAQERVRWRIAPMLRQAARRDRFVCSTSMIWLRETTPSTWPSATTGSWFTFSS